MNIKRYNNFLITEKFDDNIRIELQRLGVTDKQELERQIQQAKDGHLAKYLEKNDNKFTFGILDAIFKDAIESKKTTNIRVGILKMTHRILPMVLAPFFPIIAIIGYILGTSRAFNKVIAPILADPGNDYPSFLKKLVDETMKIAEGEIMPTKDRFTRAFVVSDDIIEMLNPEVLNKFSIFISTEISKKNPDEVVPDNFIENELKSYLNRNFRINPPLELKK